MALSGDCPSPFLLLSTRSGVEGAEDESETGHEREAGAATGKSAVPSEEPRSCRGGSACCSLAARGHCALILISRTLGCAVFERLSRSTSFEGCSPILDVAAS